MANPADQYSTPADPAAYQYKAPAKQKKYSQAEQIQKSLGQLIPDAPMAPAALTELKMVSDKEYNKGRKHQQQGLNRVSVPSNAPAWTPENVTNPIAIPSAQAATGSSSRVAQIPAPIDLNNIVDSVFAPTQLKEQEAQKLENQLTPKSLSLSISKSMAKPHDGTPAVDREDRYNLEEEMATAYKQGIDKRNARIGEYENELANLGEKPTGFIAGDMSPLMAWVDSQTGSKLSQGYKAPTVQKEWQDRKDGLRGVIDTKSEKATDDYLNYLKMKLDERKAGMQNETQRELQAMRMAMMMNRGDSKANDKVFDVENKYRHDLLGNQVTKNTAEIERWMGAIESMVNGAGIDDVGLVNAINKMLDPQSVVREKEFEIAAKSGGLIRQVGNWVHSKKTGQFLDPKTRADLINLARGVYSEQQQRQLELEGKLSQSLESYKSMYGGINPDRALPGHAERRQKYAKQTASGGSSEDQQALQWAQANRGNPDAEQILKLHGVK